MEQAPSSSVTLKATSVLVMMGLLGKRSLLFL